MSNGGAHTVAVMATASDASLCKLSAASLGYFEDPFVQYFVKSPSRRMPLINRGYYARIRSIETLLLRFLHSSPRGSQLDDATTPKQVVILGAGLDTMFFRLRHHKLLPRCEYFELDFPEVTAQKVMTIKRRKPLASLLDLNSNEQFHTAVKSGGTELHANNYHLLPCDLRDLETLQSKLAAAGIQSSAPTLFISECVLIYMEAKYSEQLIAWSASYFDDVGYVLYEQILPDDAFGRVMMDNIKARGCDLLSIHDFPSSAAQIQRFRAHDFKVVECADMNNVYYKFLDESERHKKEKLEIFDELEEFHLLQAHYCVVVAAKLEGAVANALHLGPAIQTT